PRLLSLQPRGLDELGQRGLHLRIPLGAEHPERVGQHVALLRPDHAPLDGRPHPLPDLRVGDLLEPVRDPAYRVQQRPECLLHARPPNGPALGTTSPQSTPTTTLMASPAVRCPGKSAAPPAPASSATSLKRCPGV